MAIPDSFLRKVAAQVGVPDSAYAAFAAFMNRWQPYEGGHTNNSARYNYINTTDQTGAVGTMNDVGVAVFPNEDAGARATAKTFVNGNYQNLVKAFRTGDYSNVSGLAADVNTWTTGKPTGSSNFGKALLGGSAGGGGTMTTSPSNSGTMTGLPSPPDPSQFTDPFEYAAALKDWSDTAVNIATAQKVFQGLEADPAQRAFDNQIKSYGAEIDKGKLDLETATQRVNRQLNGMAESRQRANTIAAGQEQIGKYGTAPGKTSFSGKDLGGAFDGVVKAMGLQPTDSLINYSGTQYIDPAGDMAAGDRALGLGGSLPAIPDTSANIDLGPPQWAIDQLGDRAQGTEMPRNNGVFQGGTPPPLDRDSSEPRGILTPPLHADSSEPRSRPLPTIVTTPVGSATTTAPTTAAPSLTGWTIDPRTGQMRPPAIPSSFYGGTGF